MPCSINGIHITSQAQFRANNVYAQRAHTNVNNVAFKRVQRREVGDWANIKRTHTHAHQIHTRNKEELGII